MLIEFGLDQTKLISKSSSVNEQMNKFGTFKIEYDSSQKRTLLGRFVRNRGYDDFSNLQESGYKVVIWNHSG
jgi:hypothetical protein